MATSITRDRVQFGEVQSQRHKQVSDSPLHHRNNGRMRRRFWSEGKSEEEDGIGSFFVIKRNNTFMCLSSNQLKFLDMTNYIAPGFSYDKYLKAYGCEVTKGHFTYEYMDCLERLDDTMLPPKEAFYSRLKNEGISDDDYASCEKACAIMA